MISGLALSICTITIATLWAIFWNSNTVTITKVTEKLEDKYDYIIIGAGSAGSVLASRLSEDKSATVLLLEAGGDHVEHPSLFQPGKSFQVQQNDINWDYTSARENDIFLGLNDQRAWMTRGRVLGGSSSINSLIYCRGSPFDYDQWENKYGCKGWGYDDMLPYFKKSEDIQIPNLKSSKYHGTGGPIGVSETPAITQIKNIFLQAGKEIGYPENDYNGATQTGFSACQFTVRDGVRSSTAIEYLNKIGTRENLHIRTHSLVTKVSIVDNVAKGVYFIKDGRKRHVKARKEIILSAGALNSPQILMLSGIGPKNHLNELGIPMLADLPVGQKLDDHVAIFLFATTREHISLTKEQIDNYWSKLKYLLYGTGPLAYNGIEGTAFLHIDKSKFGKERPDIQVTIYNTANFVNARGFVNYNSTVLDELINQYNTTLGFSLGIILLHPRSIGTVRLQSKDPFDSPVFKTNHFTDHQDMEDLLAGIRLAEDLMSTDIMKSIGVDFSINNGSFCSQHEFRSDDFWRCMIRHIGINFFHTTSTCKMGPQADNSSVVDLELRVHGIRGLRVCDASVLPSAVSGNPNAAIIAVAEKAADMIRGSS